MYSTNVYYYIPRQTVVLYSGNSPRRYDTVYAKNLTLHKGVDNKLQFHFINQEQKPVDITGKEITCRILSADGTTILFQKALTLTLPLTGLAELQVSDTDLLGIHTQSASYSLEIPVSSFDFPVFVDSSSGARGKVAIVDSVMPSFTPSIAINIPTHPQPANVDVTFYSSVIETKEVSVLSVQTNYTDFTGTVTMQGSTTGTEWYDIDGGQTLANNSAAIGTVIEGFHPKVRVKFVYSQGTVDRILAR